MSTTTLTAIYIPFLLIAASIFVLEIIKCIKTRRSPMLALMAVSIIFWSLGMLGLVLVADIYTSTFIWNVAIVFVSLAATAQFFVVYGIARPDYKMPIRIAALFFILPALNAIVALTPLSFLMREVELAATYPDFYLYNVRGPWFWVHAVYSYVLAVVTVLVLVKGHMKKPKFYRFSSSLAAIGVIITLIGNVVVLSGFMPLGLDATALAASITLLFFYLAISSSDHSLFSRFARSKVFGYMEDYVLVLGENGHVSDFNPSANRWFSSLGIDLRVCTLDGLLDMLAQKGAVIKDSPEGEEGRDIFFNDGGFPLVLNLRTHKMIDEKLYKHGYVAFFADVTQNRALLDRLEKEAGMDSLTGLPNRISYNGAKARYDSAEHLPLSVIMCDLNGLKETNDHLGHKYGDMMLQMVSEVMDKARAKQHFVARIGGDEFIFLLSRACEEYAASMIAQVKAGMASYDNLPFKLSVAMGAATKYEESQNLEDIIASADNLMYADKKLMKEMGA